MNTEILPSLFVSHGAPTLAIERNDTVTFLQRLGAEIGRPRSILCVSAHWTTPVPTVSAAPQPETIHDFGGFPAPLYQLRYDAPGAPGLAARVRGLLDGAGIESQIAPRRGLDHGAWIPLLLMYPEADIPVTQLSVQAHESPSAHFRMGEALAPLRREGVLILATGGAVHNLSRLGAEGSTPEWAAQFDDWLGRKIADGSYEELMEYRRLAPHGALAHPTEDHLLPLFVAMGAGSAVIGEEQVRAESLHRGWTHGSLSMAAYRFGGRTEKSRAKGSAG
ncbi:MAG TPA: class III extradiol ring-cleavage dioxygenase [Pyrinomonadaceae bacterium]|jgi:4,5-DOPA dioxygenase extradiol